MLFGGGCLADDASGVEVPPEGRQGVLEARERRCAQDVTEFITATIVNVSRGETCDVYCGRPEKWGNQFRIGMMYQGRKLDRAMAIEAHRDWFLYSTQGVVLQADIEELRGKRLGCHCAPLPCHCQNYVDFLAITPPPRVVIAEPEIVVPHFTLRRLRS